MFHPTELKSVSPRSNLFKCWVAGTNTEQKYKERYGKDSLKSIDICELCVEILEKVDTRSAGPESEQFSLRLSAQLLSGATKLLHSQTTDLERELFDIERELSSVKGVGRRDMEIDVLGSFELPDVPDLNEPFQIPLTDKDEHLISDVPNLNGGTMAVEHLNFGILSNEDLEFMMAEDLNEEAIRVIEHKESSSILLPNNQQLFMEGITMEETTVQQAFPHISTVIQTEEFVAIEGIESVLNHQPVPESSITRVEQNEECMLTPKKRSNAELQIDTPTKRRRFSFKLTVEDAKPQLLMTTEDTSALVLEELNYGYNAPRSQSKHSAIRIDKKVRIDDKKFKSATSNVMAHTKQNAKFCQPLPSSKVLFQNPTKRMQAIKGKNWAKPLLALFNKSIHNRNYTDTEVKAQTTMEVNQPEYLQIIRPTEITEKTIDVDELSAAITQIELEAKHSQILEKTVGEMREIQPPLCVETVLEERSFDNVQMESATVNDVESLSQKEQLTKQDLIAMLEVYWHDRDIIQFKEVISPSSYSRADAVHAFKMLLEMHSEGKVILKQREVSASEPLWIQKCTY